MPVLPPTAYPKGTRLTVGSHEVEIDRFIGEGGFAHVYTVTTTPVIPGYEVACLKRVQVPNKAYLNLLRAEVDAMQRLKGASNIVQYFDSHAERMHDPQTQGHYEVFLLMEFCERGGLIDFMNTRLQDRLREHEILKIMYDITLGLAHMHYLVPPLLHRDLKIENVLITGDGTFTLCDFGSVSPVLRPPKTPQEFQILEDDIQHHTTVQYRAPEMVAIARGHPIDEKSDIWALGIFLYKLCYYTTPFERPNQTLEQFQQMILAGVFTIPPRPAYSERLRNMICVLLQPDPRLRPNVFQVMQEICAMRKVECPIKDIYGPQAQQQQLQAQQQQDAIGSQMMSRQMPAGGVAGVQQAPLTFAQSVPATSQLAPPSGAQPPLPPRPAPGQVPVPGVLLTSPLATPASPLSRAMSPVDDEANVTARFPSLEELELANSSSLANFNQSPNPSQSHAAPKPLHSKSQPQVPQAIQSHSQPQVQSQALSQAHHKVSQQVHSQSQPQTPSQKYQYAPQSLSARDDDYPMPARPSRRSHESGDDELTSGKPVSSEAAKLKQILTGISGKSSTVIMDSPPENKNLSSVDFLRTLQPDASHQHHYSLKHHKGHRSSFQKYYHKKKENGMNGQDLYSSAGDDYDSDDDDDEYDGDSTYMRMRRSDSSSKHKRDPEFEEYDIRSQYNIDTDDGEFDFSERDSISPLASPSHIVPVSPKPYVPSGVKPQLAAKPGTKPQSLPVSAQQKQQNQHEKQRQQLKQKPELAKSANAALSEVTARPANRAPVADVGGDDNGSFVEAASPKHSSKAAVKPSPPKLLGAAKPKLDSVTSIQPKPKLDTVRADAAREALIDEDGPNTAPSGGSVSFNSRKPSVPTVTKPITRVATTPLPQNSRPRPKSMIIGTNELASQTTGDLDTFRPSNLIQQRVHSFLNSHDRQHPTRRTARGYGRFTDVADEENSDDSGDFGDYNLIKQTRSKSIGDAIPPTPSRASKPKVKK